MPDGTRGAQIGYFEEPVPVLVQRIRTGSGKNRFRF